jgi:hypothetical protein
MATPQMMALDQALAEVEVPPPDPGRWAEQLAGVARQLRVVIGRHRDFASLPGDRFPNLVAAAGEFAKTDLDERFEQLIAIFIAGLTEQAGRS